jgi:hypothetical protein
MYLGFYSDASCVHLAAGSGTITASFEIFLNQCGMTSSGNTETNGQPNPAGSFVENTVIIQEEQAKPNHYRAHRGTKYVALVYGCVHLCAQSLIQPSMVVPTNLCNDKPTFDHAKANLYYSNQTFIIPNQTFIIQNQSFMILNQTFIIPN